jgi:ATP-dependent DNA helicase PIF1
MLNQMREGIMTPEIIATFKSLERELKFDDGIEPTELFATRNEVENANRIRLAALQGEMNVYNAKDGGTMDPEFRAKTLANMMAPERISLKKGAQVMLIKNMDESLVNGSLGKVIGFMSETQFANYQETAAHQIAATQGGTLFDEDTLMQASKSKLPSPTETSGGHRFPIVRFAIADGTTRDLFCRPESWTVEQPNGEVSASRTQVPLILAWALSIHKAQGQTLERVKVNLARAFEKGQAYVALSRATSMEGLQVLGFDPKKVMAHSEVRQFYAGLERLEQLPKKAKLSEEREESPEFEEVTYPDIPNSGRPGKLTGYFGSGERLQFY